MITLGLHMSRSIQVVVCTTFVRNLAHELFRLYAMFITQNDKSV